MTRQTSKGPTLMGGTSPLLRKAMFGVVMGLAVLVGFENRWRSQGGGTGTQIAFAAARPICPTVRAYTPSASVADGARAIDNAALRRAADLIWTITVSEARARAPRPGAEAKALNGLREMGDPRGGDETRKIST